MRWKRALPLLPLLMAVMAFVGTPMRAQENAAAPQVIQMTAKKYEFNPSPITVERGRPVRLEITATDHTHGIEIKEFNVKVRLDKGKTTAVEFTPDKTGEFTMKCSVYCGLGHGHMKGTLVVVEPPKS